MRKTAAILMMLVFLNSCTELHQLLKLPVLVEHYKEHRSANPSLSFSQFLKIHYQKIVIDDDYQRDQQLPFRDVCAITFNLVTETPPAMVSIEKKASIVKRIFYSENIKDYFHQFLQDIFQPPRYC